MTLKNFKEILGRKNKKKQKIESDDHWMWGIIIALFVIILLIILIFSWGEAHVASNQENQENRLKSYIERLNGIISKDEAKLLDSASPEEAYEKLKEALKNDDTEAAVYQFSEEIQGDWRSTLLGMEKYDLTVKMIEELTELHKEQMDDTTARYSYINQNDGKEIKRFVDFIKDSNGNWKIKSL